MPQYRRVGSDHTADMPENADPEFWEPVGETESEPASTEAPAADPEESE